MSGGRVEIEVVPDTRGFPGKVASGLKGLQGIAGTIGKGLGVAVAAGAATAAIGLKSVIGIGIDYQSKLNELQAVSGATAAQMSQIGQTAKALGADLTLPATSAAGAAAAMLELSKGGLSVDASMKAAKGTLQLAAAASIDAAAAAEIQSNALNQFGLSADSASHVADVLANTANAASGSIGDVALALKYVGPVAKSVGVSIDDTATAIGLLANKGIQADQAGTSLRAMLAGLAAPSKPAAKALKQLGVDAFDSSGKFVGFRTVIDQLNKAQKTMTQEQFASAAATAFGREPLAAIVALAESGAPAFDDMAQAVSKQGGAADVAAAKMKGLGGAWEGLKSQLETAGISIFESIDGPLEGIVRKGSDFVERFTPAVKRGIDGAVSAGQLFGPELAKALASRADALGEVAGKLIKPLVQGVKETLNSGLEIGVKLVQNFAETVHRGVDAVEPLAKGIGKVIESFNRADGPIGAFGAALGIAYDIIKGLITVVTPVISVVAGLVTAFADLPGPIQTAALAILALKVGPSILGSLKSAFSGAGKDAGDAAEKTGIFGKALGLVTAPVKLVASGVSSAVGTVRQFSGEMAVQRSLAAQSGVALGGLSDVVAAYHTSTIPAVAATRGLTDQFGQIRAGAVGANQPVSLLGASIGLLAERSSTVAKARDAFQRTFESVSKSADNAALSIGVAVEQIGPNLTNALGKTRDALSSTVSAIGGFGGSIRSGFSSAVSGVATGVSTMVESVKVVPTAVGVAAISLRENLAGAARSVGETFAAIPGKIAALPTALGVGFLNVIEKVPGAVTGTVSAIGKLGAAATGAASAAGSLLKSAGTGLVAALGGPFGIAIGVATLGLSLLAGAQEEAAQKAREHEKGVDTLASALRESAGVIDSRVRKVVGEDLVNNYKDATSAAAKLGIGLDDVTSAALKQGSSFDDLKKKLEGIVKAGTTQQRDPSGQALPDQMSDEAVAAQKLLDALNDLGGKSDEAEKKNKALGEAIRTGHASMLDATDSGRTFASAMKTLSDNTASADDKARALKDALDAFSGGQVSLDEATSRLNEQFDRLSDTFGKNLDQSKGFGAELITSAGRINTTTENGRALRQSLDDITTSTLDVAQKTFDMTGSLDSAKQVVQDSRDKFIAMAQKMGLSSDQAGLLADQMGLIPSQVATLISMPGMTDAQKEVILFQGILQRTPPGKDVVIRSLTADAEKILESFGFKVTHMPDGSVSIHAETSGATSTLDTWIRSQEKKTITIHAQATTGSVKFNAAGGILEPFASGGIKPLRPMRGGVAQMVPANAWRVIGDRMWDDEAYIPINQSSGSVALLQEAADRMGFALLRRFAAGGVAVAGAPTTSTPATVSRGGDTFNIFEQTDPVSTATEVQRRQSFSARLK